MLAHTFNAYSNGEISFINNQRDVVQVDFEKPRIQVRAMYREQKPIIDNLYRKKISFGNSILINSNKEFYLFNKNVKIKIEDSGLECYWIHIFNIIKKIHCYFLILYVNDLEMGKICATKYSSVDYKVHANLELVKNSKNIFALKFYNTGWWGEKSVDTEELEVILDYDINFSK